MTFSVWIYLIPFLWSSSKSLNNVPHISCEKSSPYSFFSRKNISASFSVHMLYMLYMQQAYYNVKLDCKRSKRLIMGHFCLNLLFRERTYSPKYCISTRCCRFFWNLSLGWPPWWFTFTKSHGTSKQTSSPHHLRWKILRYTFKITLLSMIRVIFLVTSNVNIPCY